MRQIVNKDQAKVEQAKAMLEKDDSAKSWKQVAAKYSTDQATKATAACARGTKGQSDPAVDAQIFSAAQGAADRARSRASQELLPDRGRQDHPGVDDAALAGQRPDQAAAEPGPSAADRHGLPDQVRRQVDASEASAHPATSLTGAPTSPRRTPAPATTRGSPATSTRRGATRSCPRPRRSPPAARPCSPASRARRPRRDRRPSSRPAARSSFRACSGREERRHRSRRARRRRTSPGG